MIVCVPAIVHEANPAQRYCEDGRDVLGSHVLNPLAIENWGDLLELLGTSWPARSPRSRSTPHTRSDARHRTNLTGLRRTRRTGSPISPAAASTARMKASPRTRSIRTLSRKRDGSSTHTNTYSRACGATFNRMPTTRTRSWSRTHGTSTPHGTWDSPTARATTPRPDTHSSTATSGASIGWV